MPDMMIACTLLPIKSPLMMSRREIQQVEGFYSTNVDLFLAKAQTRLSLELLDGA
jgi:hypothetical protein